MMTRRKFFTQIGMFALYPLAKLELIDSETVVLHCTTKFPRDLTREQFFLIKKNWEKSQALERVRLAYKSRGELFSETTSFQSNMFEWSVKFKSLKTYHRFFTDLEKQKVFNNSLRREDGFFTVWRVHRNSRLLLSIDDSKKIAEISADIEPYIDFHS